MLSCSLYSMHAESRRASRYPTANFLDLSRLHAAMWRVASSRELRSAGDDVVRLQSMAGPPTTTWRSCAASSTTSTPSPHAGRHSEMEPDHHLPSSDR